MKEAIAALDAAGDALADDRAGAGERGGRRFAPRRVVRMDERGRGPGRDLVAELDQRLEETGVGRIE